MSDARTAQRQALRRCAGGRARWTRSGGHKEATGQAKGDWLLRWEYFRQPPQPDYPYPLAHLHVNGALASVGRALPKLHVPTGRVPLELALWHLIAEWDVKPKRDDWRELLQESIDASSAGDAHSEGAEDKIVESRSGAI